MENKKKLSPVLLIAIAGIVIVLVVVSIFIFNRGDDTADTPENGDNSQQPTSQPDTKFTLEDLTSANLGLECTPEETSLNISRSDLTALEIDIINETYGPGEEGLNKYIEASLQIQGSSCETDAGTQLFVALSDQIEESEFHNFIDAYFTIDGFPTSSECAVGPYLFAEFANAVMSYENSVQRSAAAEREAHIALLTEVSESLGGKLQDKCENITINEEESAKTQRLADTSAVLSAINTYVGNNNGKLPSEVDQLQGAFSSLGFGYYTDGVALTGADMTAIGTTPLTSSTASQYLVGDYNQIALAEASLPDVDHFHIIFGAGCNGAEEHSDYSTIGEGGPRSFALVFRADKDKVRCIDNI